MTRTITGMFDTRAEADRAVAQLVSQLDLDRDRVQVYASGAATAGTSTTTEDTGFWASLKNLFVPDEDRAVYGEGIRRGGVVVSAQVEESRLDAAMDIFEHGGAVDLDAREAEWRGTGWRAEMGDAIVATDPANPAIGIVGTTRGTTAGTMSTAGVPDGAPGNPSGTMLSRGVDQVAGTNISGAHPENERAAMPAAAMPGAATGTATTGVGTTGAATARGSVEGEEVIPIVEERLTVGKRDVERGRVRVRSYVVETPVSEQVTLRDETVRVERRAVDLPLSAADDAFRERTIEAVERDEEAVVAKEARVKEELVIRKDVGERVETIQDKVRRTEVEVEDDRSGGTTSPIPPVRRS